MVSPSKIQRHEHNQPPREIKPSKHSHVRTQKGLKPLDGKSFYLDIKNHAVTAKIEAKIKGLGGVIELFLVRSVNLVISDRVGKDGYVNLEKHKWGCASGGSGGPPSLRSIETPTPMPTPPTPFFSPDCPLSNSSSLRGQTTQRSKSRVDAMLERALIQPQQCSVDPLYNAQSWGIPIWAIDKLQAWLDKIYSSVKDANSFKRSQHSDQRCSSSKDLKVRHLKGSYLKFESFQRTTRPVFVELPVWPTLNFSGDPGSCPFNTKKREKLERVRKDIKENREANKPIKQEEDREMTRRPRTTATRARRTEHLASGYCEICRISYRDLSKHVRTDQHLSYVQNDDNFLSLDTLIKAGADVETFLKLNRTKDIEKGCNLFTNGDHSLHDIVLPEGKVNRNAKSLGDFEVEDIKMVQCNGTRRNLNLRLSSPHNLRTRAKHESGHLLRSKGSPWHEGDKTEKLYDKFEGFTIKKRSKGTIWIEEDEPGDKFARENELKESKHNEYKIKTFSSEIKEKCNNSEKDCKTLCNECPEANDQDVQPKKEACNNDPYGTVNTEYIKQVRDTMKHRNHDQINGSIKSNSNENVSSTNGNNCIDFSRIKVKNGPKSETFKGVNCKQPSDNAGLKKGFKECNETNTDVTCNGLVAEDDQTVGETFNSAEKNDTKEDKIKSLKPGKRGGRNLKGRHRLSVEERLIEDNRAYYKVEVLGSKLRSSVVPNSNSQCVLLKDAEGEEKKEVPSSEKPVVVRFKRVRKSELSLLSDEAESFMFGEPRKDDFSETSDGEQSSVLPRDSESECNDSMNSICPSSSLNSSSPVKSEPVEEDSQDSLNLGRARKRRRTQTEALIKDNVDYYKFETPGSRLRYQAPLTGIKESSSVIEQQPEKTEEVTEKVPTDGEKIYPSKPSPEVEKMHFSFEAVPKSEPWYQTYQRQDEGAEFWHYFSEGDSKKPFLLPYEVENFHEMLSKIQNRSENKKRGRGRSTGCVGRSPRKSPRCHASTLAIMSTIIRKREQQSLNLYTIDECQSERSETTTPRPDQKVESKSDVDEDLKEMVKTIDEMLNANDTRELDNSFEPDVAQMELNYDPIVPKGPPANLLELLENCHEIVNCLENSSCASSECGEANTESSLKRRKKRKNRTGWPGIKLKKKLQVKAPVDADCERGTGDLTGKSVEREENASVSNDRLVGGTNRIVMSVSNGIAAQDGESLGFSQRKDEKCIFDASSYVVSPTKECEEDTEKKDVSIEIIENSVLHTSTTCTDPLIPDTCNETDRNFVLNNDYTFGKDLSEIDLGNDENHENVFRKDPSFALAERRFIAKASMKKRQRENTSSETCESRIELENAESRKHHNANGLSTRKRQQQKGHSENPDSEIEHHDSIYKNGSRATSKKRIYSKKCGKKGSDSVFEDENCKKESYLSITYNKKQENVRGVKRRADAMSSDTQDSEVDLALSDHVSPSIIATSDLGQRRSSIEFQPVVRMMKIDEQVDVDHSILSVTIASNRRLRSSSSPRSNAQPPKKRLKTSRGQFGRWLKSS